METANTTQLTGKTACAGTARGRPRIVSGRDDLSSVKDGDVLVAKETCIDFVPAMQRASAVITETGGRFCHAAVWARENQKPTILQVEDATSLLSQASIAFVNADAGTIDVEA